MRMIIAGDFSKEDFVKFAIFLKDLWRHRPDLLSVFVTHGFEDVSSEDLMKIFSEIFEKDKDWSSVILDPKTISDFYKRIGADDAKN